MKMNPYLMFDGDCAAAFKHYAKVLGGKLDAMTFAGSPAEAQAAPGWQKKILHARLEFDGQVLMGSDGPGPGGVQKPRGFSVNLGFTDVAEGERVFNALLEGGGKVQMPFGKTFWAERFGMLVDRFGVPWMVNCESHG